MAATKSKSKRVEPLLILDPNTGELTDLPNTPVQDARLDAASLAEARGKRRWLGEADTISRVPKELLVACALVGALGLGAFLGGAGQGWLKQSSEAHQIALAMRTAIPVVRSLTVDVDPGKFDGKLVDVVMSINRGGVYKSGKGLYLQEYEGGMSLVVFQSAFAGFGEGMEDHPDRIVSQYIGKVVKARGTVRSFGQQADGQKRMSMVIYAPGLLSEVPER